MTCDKVRRVQSIRKWLEKAEKSFSSDKEISGELNLIMAQAEMQRLKETDAVGERRRVWGFRIVALAAAFLVVSGMTIFRETQTTAEVTPIAVSSPLPARQEKMKTGETMFPVVAASEPKEIPAEEIVSPSIESRAAEAAPVATMQETRLQPVLSQQEIQSVVGEAGRALRGQS